MSPIHHHFELKGWKETKVVIRFGFVFFLLLKTSYLKIKIMIGPLEDWEKLMAAVAILGGGVSGRGVSALLQRLGWKFRVYDELGIKLTPAKLRSSSLVVVSPGFRPDHPWLLLARQMKIKVLGELDFASCFTASPITAITGTNGKTTVATLLHHALSKLGHVTSTAGNIGLPLSQFVAEQVNVKTRILLEVSSFQSRNISSCSDLIWTNFAGPFGLSWDHGITFFQTLFYKNVG